MVPVAAMAPAEASLFRSSFSSLLDDHLIVSTGEVTFDVPKRVLAPFRHGLKVAVALSGEMSCRIDERPPITMTGPNVFLILNDADHRREQVFAADQRLRYVLVQMSPTLIEEKFDIRFDELMLLSRRFDGPHGPVALSRPADKTIRAIASKIIGCPVRGIARNIYITGAALELVALALDQFMPLGERRGIRLPMQDMEKIEEARDLLLRSYREPPLLSALARAVGLNTRKLNAGFRQVFGMTVYAFLQEHRLQTAYRSIAAGETSVSEAAYQVGYAPAHFATIFRKRYGFSPSDLR